MLIKFLKSRTVQDGTGTAFVEGNTYDLPEASADRWIRRNVAVAVTDQPKGNPAEKLLVSQPEAKPEPVVESAKVEAVEETPPMMESRPQLQRSRPDALKRSDIKRN